MKNESNKIVLANKYFRYKKLIDKCEFYERKISDRDFFLNIYKTLDSSRGVYKIIEELKTDSNCYFELCKNNPNDNEYKNIYKYARNLLILFNEFNLQLKR